MLDEAIDLGFARNFWLADCDGDSLTRPYCFLSMEGSWSRKGIWVPFEAWLLALTKANNNPSLGCIAKYTRFEDFIQRFHDMIHGFLVSLNSRLRDVDGDCAVPIS